MTPKEYALKYIKLQDKIDYINTQYEDLLSLNEDYIDLLEQRITELESPKTCETCKYWEHDKNGVIDPNLMFGDCNFFGIQGKLFYCSNYELKDA